MTQSNFIFHAHTAQGGDSWRDAPPVNFVFYFIHLESERLVYPFLEKMAVGRGDRVSKSSIVAWCIYIMGIQLETLKGG